MNHFHPSNLQFSIEMMQSITDVGSEIDMELIRVHRHPSNLDSMYPSTSDKYSSEELEREVRIALSREREHPFVPDVQMDEDLSYTPSLPDISFPGMEISDLSALPEDDLRAPISVGVLHLSGFLTESRR